MLLRIKLEQKRTKNQPVYGIHSIGTNAVNWNWFAQSVKFIRAFKMFILYLLILFGSACYLWLKSVYSYWSRTKFSYLKPNIPFGNMYDSATGTKSMGINLYELHKSSSEPIIGIYLLFRPALLVRDADLAKNILTTDFASFHDRGIYTNPNDPVANHMLMLPGEEWKRIRSKLTPTFTSGKLKGMMPVILQIAENLKQKLLPSAEKEEIVEMKDLLMRCVCYVFEVPVGI